MARQEDDRAEIRTDAAERVKNRAKSVSEQLRIDVAEASPERVAKSQQELLDKISDSGILDVFKGIAQGLSETFPDIELRMSCPTGNLSDEMVVALNYRFEALSGQEVVFHQIYGYLTDGQSSRSTLHIAIGAIPSLGGKHEEFSSNGIGFVDQVLTDTYISATTEAVGNAISQPQATQVPLSEPRQFQLIPYQITQEPRS